MNITFDKELKQRVFQMVESKVEDKRCPFCLTPIRAKNFAGAAFINGEFRMFNGDFVCIIMYADYVKENIDPDTKVS